MYSDADFALNIRGCFDREGAERFSAFLLEVGTFIDEDFDDLIRAIRASYANEAGID
jgi:hypothetical protein